MSTEDGKSEELLAGDKLELIAQRSFPEKPELVYVVDFLNKNLKNRKIMFGLSKDKNNLERMVIKIYEF